MGGGGKGGSKTQTNDIPEWVKPYAKENLERAKSAQTLGYIPYYGPDIAAFNPTQMAAFGSNINAAEAFGLIPKGQVSPLQDMAPTPTTYAGGIQGYSSGDLFDQAVAELAARRPGQVSAYNKLFVDPYSGSYQNLYVEPPKPVQPAAPSSWDPRLTGGR